MAITKATASSVAPAAKGDLVVGSATNDAAVLAVGTNDYVLTADSSTATGLKWAAVSAGGMTSLASGSIAASATGFDLQSISNAYNELWLYITNYSMSENSSMILRVNNNSSADYSKLSVKSQESTVSDQTGSTSLYLTGTVTPSLAGNSAILRFPNYKNTTGWKLVDSIATHTNEYQQKHFGLIKSTSAIDRITITCSPGTFDSGTYELFGVK